MERKKQARNQLTGSKSSNGPQSELLNVIRTEALHYLPAKSLARFKGVCQDWKLHIANPFFAHKQSNKFRDLSGFFAESAAGHRSFVSLDPASCGVPDPALSFLPDLVKVNSSSNGLICCQSLKADGTYFICNPVTKAWKGLPRPNLKHGPDPALILIFEPSPLVFEAEYKLLCACPCADFDDGYEFELYDSKSGAWKVFGEIYLGNKKLSPMPGVHVDGTAHWLTNERGGILCFDLRTERSKLVYGFGPIGVMDSRLCSAKIVQRTLVICKLASTREHTAAMPGAVKPWQEVRKVDLGPVGMVNYEADTFENSTCHLVYLSEKCVVFLDGKNGLCLYDMESGECRVLSGNAGRGFKVVGYVNSLVEI